MSRRVVVLAVAGLLTVLLAAASALLPVPYVALKPGPTTNTLGKVGSTELIRIEGRQTYQDKGHLDLVTVSVQGGPRQKMDLITAIAGWLDDTVAVVPETTVYPKGETAKQAEQESNAEMTQSQQSATTAALRQLGIPVTSNVRVTTLSPKSPAAGLLRAGDVVVSVDGTAVDGGAALRDAITSVQAGDTVRLVVRRAGKRVAADVVTAAATDDGRPIIGVSTRDKVTYPFTVEISLRDVGGPSAGLMFALGIVDKLTPGSLTGGKYIAGTGTIDDQGQVGEIGGITQKMVGARRNGATVFLSPMANCAQARSTKPDGLRLVKVDTLTDAVTALDDLRSGRAADLPRC
ncbi:MAG: PDZ domain-containing protein [Sporichthyaceae bacterium]